MIYETTPTRVLRGEHLAAIALQTRREKDRYRVRLLLKQAAIDDRYTFCGFSIQFVTAGDGG